MDEWMDGKIIISNMLIIAHFLNTSFLNIWNCEHECAYAQGQQNYISHHTQQARVKEKYCWGCLLWLDKLLEILGRCLSILHVTFFSVLVQKQHLIRQSQAILSSGWSSLPESLTLCSFRSPSSFSPPWSYWLRCINIAPKLKRNVMKVLIPPVACFFLSHLSCFPHLCALNHQFSIDGMYNSEGILRSYKVV